MSSLGDAEMACYQLALPSRLCALLFACLPVSAGLCLSCSSAPDVVAVRQPAPLTPELLTLTGDLALGDPSAIYVDQQYWVFSSGGALPIRTSTKDVDGVAGARDPRDADGLVGRGDLTGAACVERERASAARHHDELHVELPKLSAQGGRKLRFQRANG